MVDPAVLCRKHLLGEHVECHMFVGAILKGISLAGYKAKGLIEIHNLKLRHEALSREMLKRGYRGINLRCQYLRNLIMAKLILMIIWRP